MRWPPACGFLKRDSPTSLIHNPKGMPRLSTVHPYPAMMPDELVTSLVRQYGGDKLLDPFCGTGRICLAAAEAGSVAVGIDVNPLAVLLSRAKSHSVDAEDLSNAMDDLLESKRSGKLVSPATIDPYAGRKVEWFGRQAAMELGEIVTAIDMKQRTLPTQLILAAVLSATAREVSFVRHDQWKLHRLRRKARVAVRQDAWNVFERRLRSAWREIATLGRLSGRCRFILGDARDASVILGHVLQGARVDAIITSPPYGDSKSTVQYGGVSSLCMDVVSKLRAFQPYRIAGPQVELDGLGGRIGLDEAEARRTLAGYWSGGARNPRCRTAGMYLHDLRASILSSASCLRPGGLFVTVIARRLIGGWRLHTDEFIDDTLRGIGFARVERKLRRIAAKVTPPTVNRVARGTDTPGRSRVRTMREEWILVHRSLRDCTAL